MVTSRVCTVHIRFSFGESKTLFKTIASIPSAIISPLGIGLLAGIGLNRILNDTALKTSSLKSRCNTPELTLSFAEEAATLHRSLAPT
jgi:hypothetical protein